MSEMRAPVWLGGGVVLFQAEDFFLCLHVAERVSHF